jgi:hypothetical protein
MTKDNRTEMDNTADRIAGVLDIDPERVMISPGESLFTLSYAPMRRLLLLAEKIKLMQAIFKKSTSGWLIPFDLVVDGAVASTREEAIEVARTVLTEAGINFSDHSAL